MPHGAAACLKAGLAPKRVRLKADTSAPEGKDTGTQKDTMDHVNHHRNQVPALLISRSIPKREKEQPQAKLPLYQLWTPVRQ
jgi:hypothetical protein